MKIPEKLDVPFSLEDDDLCFESGSVHENADAFQALKRFEDAAREAAAAVIYRTEKDDSGATRCGRDIFKRMVTELAELVGGPLFSAARRNRPSNRRRRSRRPTARGRRS